MAILAHLAFGLAFLLPQEDLEDSRFTSVLTTSEKSSLNRKAKAWFDVWMDYEAEENSSKRISIRKKLSKARVSFFKEWESKSKRKNPLANVGDLLAVFEGVFPYKSQSASGEVKRIKLKDKEDPEYSQVLPRGYRPKSSYPAVMLVPGYNESRGSWEEDSAYFKATWKGNAFGSKSVMVIPRLPDEMLLDPVPDLGRVQDQVQEMNRVKAIFSPIGAVQRTIHLDRERLILDCGKGASGFGVRIMTYFPDRFAGLIVRHPADIGKTRIDSLMGTPVLIVRSQETKDAADKLREGLDGLLPGNVTVIEAEGEYPYSGLSDQIGEWARGVKRDLYRKKVSLVPNHDSFKKGYWVNIVVAESLDTVSEKDRPHLTAEADKDANRITITTKSISSIRLSLNDALIDLDKEFTIVVNGKGTTIKRSRNLLQMTETMFRRFDSGYLFTAEYALTVPKDSDGSGSDSGVK